MIDVAAILKALPPSQEVATILQGQGYEITDRAVRAWNLADRRRIPGKYWPALVRLAQDRGIPDITYEALERAHNPALDGAA